MLIALLTLMLLSGDSYDLTEFIAEGQRNMEAAVEDSKRRQTALDILAEMEQTMAADKTDTTALIERTQHAFTEEKIWSAEKLDALFTEARALRANRAEHFMQRRLELKAALHNNVWSAAFPES